MEIRFDNKRVLVTGAAKGIGREISVSLARAGAHVVAMGRDEAALKSLREFIANDCKAQCSYVVADLADVAQTQKAVHDAIQSGPIDLLVNNAGVAHIAPFLDLTVEQWDATMDVNVRALFLVTQLVARDWVARAHRGVIVNVSSQASMVSLPGHVAYCASKGAVDQLTRVTALELGAHGIRCNAVNPTVVLTEMGKQNWSDPAKADPMLRNIPLGRFAEPHEVADAVLYLLSERASFISGVMLPIDGGFLATGMK
jgi:NAD(P)-dependent dehydrogenase (short-subunit alcohol dehydrogenase family)